MSNKTKETMKYHRACEADILALGWRPGFTYYSEYWRRADVVLGYNKGGSVIVRDVQTGVERAHCTRRTNDHYLCSDVENVFGWNAIVTRKHREKVTS